MNFLRTFGFEKWSQLTHRLGTADKMMRHAALYIDDENMSTVNLFQFLPVHPYYSYQGLQNVELYDMKHILQPFA